MEMGVMNSDREIISSGEAFRFRNCARSSLSMVGETRSQYYSAP